jgi:hypothetical protein
MNLNLVSARTGLVWVRLGVSTFWRQPLAMSGLFFLFMATVSVVSMLPFVGSALALVALPALTWGMMAATQVAADGKFPMPSVLFAAFRVHAPRRAMLQLGAGYAAVFLLVMGASVLVDGGGFARVYFGGAPMSAEAVNNASFQSAMWVAMLLYVPLSMLFWHAPALVYLHAVSPGKALFFSFVACWRNLRAFVAYALAWVLVFVATSVLSLLVASVLGNSDLMAAVFMPLALMVAAMFFTSMWFTVRDCFALPQGRAPDTADLPTSF